MGTHGVDPKVVQLVQNLIDKDQLLGPVTLWKQIRSLLEHHKLIFELQSVSPNVVLCHPSNRGQLGLNAHTAHRCGSRILSVGCDRDELEKAVSIEMQPDPLQREAQIRFNQALVDRSHRLLAPVNGSERYLSLGGGHAVAFARAVLAGCPTPQADLKDTDGHLNEKTLTAKDATFGMCLAGWRHTVISFKCELAWPRLPSLVQRALNASQNVAEHQTELETMCTIAEYAEAHDDPNWEECADAAVASRPPCAPYAQVLAKFVRYYSGGPGAPIVRWLDGFAKQYAENRKLGEDFLRTASAQRDTLTPNALQPYRLQIASWAACWQQVYRKRNLEPFGRASEIGEAQATSKPKVQHETNNTAFALEFPNVRTIFALGLRMLG